VPRRLPTRVVLACCLASASLAAAEAPEAQGHLLDAPKFLLKDALAVATAPSDWGRQEWLAAGLGLAAVAGTALLLDRPVRVFARDHRNPGADRVALQVERFGGDYSFAIVGGFYAYGKLMGREEAARTGVEALEASLITSGLNSVVKRAVGRSRPSAEEGPFQFRPFGTGQSLPSGHTAQAFTVAAVIAEHYPEPWVRWVVYGTATLVGAARIQQDVHYASDVVAGALLGSLVGHAVVRLNRARRAGMKVTVAPEFGAYGYRGATLTLKF